MLLKENFLLLKFSKRIGKQGFILQQMMKVVRVIQIRITHLRQHQNRKRKEGENHKKFTKKAEEDLVLEETLMIFLTCLTLVMKKVRRVNRMLMQFLKISSLLLLKKIKINLHFLKRSSKPRQISLIYLRVLPKSILQKRNQCNR